MENGEGGGEGDGGREEKGIVKGVLMKSTPICVLIIGVVLLGVSSCATVPTKSLAPGELRLLSMVVPEKEKIKAKCVRFSKDDIRLFLESRKICKG